MKTLTAYVLPLALGVCALGTLAGCDYSAAVFAAIGGVLAADALSNACALMRVQAPC